VYVVSIGVPAAVAACRSAMPRRASSSMDDLIRPVWPSTVVIMMSSAYNRSSASTSMVRLATVSLSSSLAISFSSVAFMGASL
jgi:hypothetical protein